MVGTPKNRVGRKLKLFRGGLMLESFEKAHSAAGDQPAVQTVA